MLLISVRRLSAIVLKLAHKKNSKDSTWYCALWGLFLFFILSIALGSTVSSCSGGGVEEDVTRLGKEVFEMRKCQRKADNINFYLHKYNADRLIAKYDNSESGLSAEELRRLNVVRGYYSIVYSDYLLQIGNKKAAIDVIEALSMDKGFNLNTDTLLWLNYLSHQGQVSFYPYDIKKHRKSIERGYDCLVQCYIFATRNKEEKYKAVSMQLLSQYFLIDSIIGVVKEFDAASLRYINEDAVLDTLLAGNLAERALNIFLTQNDYYYTAKAWCNLATCYFYINEAQKSVQCLNNALANPAIDSMPDVKANISEQMSMSYAALDDKNLSDYYRNKYLDLQDSTRQDRQYEARIISLEATTNRIWVLASIAFVVFLALCLLTLILVRLRHRKDNSVAQDDEIEMLTDTLRAIRLRYSDALRAMVEQYARVYVIKGVLSLIDRIKNAVNRGDYDYASDVLDDIERQNTMLTKWIRLDQGKVMPKIETFSISEILSVIGNLALRLATQNVKLTIKPSTTTVKADKSLTLFMLNTLIDNSRKSGAESIEVDVEEIENRAVISVSDTGKGMTPEQVEHLFDIKQICDEEHNVSHGFGLQNCYGIIERYRKISSIFSVCSIKAVSQLGKGTRIMFTLPLKVMLVFMIISFSSFSSEASTQLETYADSLYKCNVERRYVDAMRYADFCKVLTRNTINVPKEKEEVYLSIYNETAVASLALHQWHSYQYYNYLYTQLYKRATEDKTLPDYCRNKQRGEFIANISMFIVLLLIASLLPIFWFAYLGPLLRSRRKINDEKSHLKENINKVESEYDRIHVVNNILSNHLSTIKHETMYYPSRLRQLMLSSNIDRAELHDTINYYSQLYLGLCSQMISTASSVRAFPVSHLPLSDTLSDVGPQYTVYANTELLNYMMLLLKRQNGGTMPSYTIVTPSKLEDGNYLTIMFEMSNSQLSADMLPQLFSHNSVHTDYLVMRQIIREIVNATLAYGAGIHATMQGENPMIVVRLPKEVGR